MRIYVCLVLSTCCVCARALNDVPLLRAFGCRGVCNGCLQLVCCSVELLALCEWCHICCVFIFNRDPLFACAALGRVDSSFSPTSVLWGAIFLCWCLAVGWVGCGVRSLGWVYRAYGFNWCAQTCCRRCSRACCSIHAWCICHCGMVTHLAVKGSPPASLCDTQLKNPWHTSTIKYPTFTDVSAVKDVLDSAAQTIMVICWRCGRWCPVLPWIFAVNWILLRKHSGCPCRHWPSPSPGSKLYSGFVMSRMQTTNTVLLSAGHTNKVTANWLTEVSTQQMPTYYFYLLLTTY